MKASFVDLRQKSNEIIRALQRNERVTLFYRGKPTATVLPIQNANDCTSAEKHPAFGMWATRKDMTDPTAYVRQLREARFRDF